MIKKILVPIDFSPTSIDAFYYAGELAKMLGASIDLIHVHHATNENNVLSKQSNNHTGKSVLEQLEEVGVSLPQYSNSIIEPKVSVRCKVLEGLVVSTILEELAESGTDIIIMGTTGKHSALERSIGSVSTSVAQIAPCPVLMIPTGFKFKYFENILYALDYESVNSEVLYKNIAFANLFRAALHFVHVNNSETVNPAIEDIIYQALFDKGYPSFAFNIISVPNKSVVKGLNNYIKNNEIDMLVLVNQHAHFMDNIMGKSITKQMGLYTQIPLMVYPVK